MTVELAAVPTFHECGVNRTHTVCCLNIYTTFTSARVTCTVYQITSVDFNFSHRHCTTIGLPVPTGSPTSVATLYAFNKDKTNTWPRGPVAMPMQIVRLLTRYQENCRFKAFRVFPMNYIL